MFRAAGNQDGRCSDSGTEPHMASEGTRDAELWGRIEDAYLIWPNRRFRDFDANSPRSSQAGREAAA